MAAKWAGFETIGFCEIEEFPRQVLAKNFPGVPIYKDIRDLDGKDYAGIELITGGYPCQPFSTAGKRQGDQDDRHLWPEMLRVIKQARPAKVVAENVNGHIAMGLDQVLLDLESEGYTTRTLVIPACAVDAQHRRDRVWIVANSNSERELQPKGFEALADTSSSGCEERSWDGGMARKAKASEPWEAFERNHRWPIEPAVGRMAYGIPRRVDRIRGLGNAIVPQVAYEIFRAIQASEKQRL